MKTRFWLFRGLAVVLLALCTLSVVMAEPIDRQKANQILVATGVKGGLIVHIGCGDGALTAALGAGEGYIVQGLDTDVENIEKAKKTIMSKGLYGKVTAREFDGKDLPFIDNLVNLVVATGKCKVSEDEILRILAPRGIAFVNGKKTVKPWPAELDEWTHFHHDPQGTMVGKDQVVGPPKRLRWVPGPRWCRSHEFPSSVNAVVTAGGRVFIIFDEGPTGVYRNLPQRCKLIARDASNGVLLRKVPMRDWQSEFGTGVGNRWNIHHTIPRQLVAEGDRVYVTLGFLDSPISVLDAATGEILIAALKGTKGTDEMLLCDGVLIVKTTKERSVGATARIGKDTLDDGLAAVDVKTGKLLWRKKDVRVLPYALSAQAWRIVYHNMEGLVCVDARGGNEIWRTPNTIVSTLAGDRLFAAGIPDKLDPKHPLAAFEGRVGALLQVFSADGSLVKSHSLSSLPAFDGLSAASGRLYLATVDGKVICLGDAVGKLASSPRLVSSMVQKPRLDNQGDKR